MSPSWRIVRAGADEAGGWSTLRAALWPHEDPARHAADIRQVLGRGDTAVGFLALDVDDARTLGFAEATLRSDYVNGCESSPVGFLEGWYVLPDARSRGIGRALVAAVEDWARQRGCTELASDAPLENVDAQRAHQACGFDEAERVIYFHKRLAP
ncbi:aminoglycoside 6'-N-acetyltransferase [Agrilutibacter solisilvae]|uniref:Aminoglycoside N(6')-acetyltransferase type 1 n=1 Tax=Agrilutibacter solisilvae TaxID=2763317 RepID=A0A974XZ25_9GAMM|nr:aminoglycoside 6'-N-acetyltransferase [Lysobacter solisilvae]QSX78416.1 GNAT family N-acetyltransferase [Lysobacter solisilvae]